MDKGNPLPENDLSAETEVKGSAMLVLNFYIQCWQSPDFLTRS